VPVSCRNGHDPGEAGSLGDLARRPAFRAGQAIGEFGEPAAWSLCCRTGTKTSEGVAPGWGRTVRRPARPPRPTLRAEQAVAIADAMFVADEIART